MKALEQELENTTTTYEAIANQGKSNGHLKLLIGLRLLFKRIDDRVATVLKKLDEAKRIQAMDYLGTIPVGSHHNEKMRSMHDAMLSDVEAAGSQGCQLGDVDASRRPIPQIAA